MVSTTALGPFVFVLETQLILVDVTVSAHTGRLVLTHGTQVELVDGVALFERVHGTQLKLVDAG